jgi:outer membrane protein TolC
MVMMLAGPLAVASALGGGYYLAYRALAPLDRMAADTAQITASRLDRRTADIDLVRVQAQVANDVVASYKARLAASEAMTDARESVSVAMQSLELNLTNIRRGAGLPGATRLIEVLQPIQALAQARSDYLAAVLAYNRAQFHLYRAIGQPPLLDSNPNP